MKTLIQLVGEQAMPNLLAAIATRPDRIVHLWTPKTRHSSECLRDACNAAGITARIRFVELSGTPGIEETRAAVSRVAAEESGCLVNFTGGTKPMSIGAYVAAAAKGLPSLYVDTDSGEFRDGATAGGFPDLFVSRDTSLTTAKAALDVHVIACANGVPFVDEGRDWRTLAPLADLLLRNEFLETACFREISPACEAIGRTSNWFAKRDVILDWFGKPLPPFPAPVLEVAERCGLVESRAGRKYWNPDLAADCRTIREGMHPRAITDALNKATDAFDFFHGKWWEVAVAAFLDGRGVYRDLRWSVQTSARDQNQIEEDVLGVEGAGLLYVSCKHGDFRKSLARTVEEVDASARRLGGTFARKILAVCNPPGARQEQSLRRRCAQLGIELLFRADLLK